MIRLLKNWKLRIEKSICMCKCLCYDCRQSTALCLMQHHTLGTYFSSQLESLSLFSTSRFAQHALFLLAFFMNRLVVSSGFLGWYLIRGSLLIRVAVYQALTQLLRKRGLCSISLVSYPSVFTFQNISIASSNVNQSAL